MGSTHATQRKLNKNDNGISNTKMHLKIFFKIFEVISQGANQLINCNHVFLFFNITKLDTLPMLNWPYCKFYSTQHITIWNTMVPSTMIQCIPQIVYIFQTLLRSFTDIYIYIYVVSFWVNSLALVQPHVWHKEQAYSCTFQCQCCNSNRYR